MKVTYPEEEKKLIIPKIPVYKPMARMIKVLDIVELFPDIITRKRQLNLLKFLKKLGLIINHKLWSKCLME